MPMNRFQGKRAFITGAGSGLGQALAIVLARRGWKIGVAEIDPDRTRKTSQDVNQAGGEALAIPCDVTRPENLEAAADAILAQWGGIDLVINNAGVSGCGLMEEIDPERWEWIFNINLKSVIYGCRAFIPMLKNQGSGHIVNVASYLGFVSAPESSCYNVTKAGIISLSETLRIELAKNHIGVSVVMPSFFKTNLMEQLYAAGERQEKLVRALFEKTNVKPDKVAHSILKGIAANRFYILPQWDAKLIWLIKRFSPELYLRLFSFIYRKALVEKFFRLQ
ncbi:MAG: SDR family NAD(P)-dependent oxidoreductase [Desulfobacteraceae bacterium]|nr:MAG: SDR family NAD(P)-dependent oxidoreductase [Desulfobacteraceae bacterium]